jgi:hypothetical protein
MNIHRERRSVAGVIGAGLGLVLLMGCASAKTVPTQPFQEFHGSITQLKLSADAAIAVEQELVYARIVEEWKASGTVDQLQLESGATPFSMQLEEAPLFQLIGEARDNLGAINDLVLQYAETLEVLAGSGDGSPKVDADAVANNLRASADSLATTLGIENQIPGGFFFGFGELAKSYVENKRQDALIELIRSSQPEIDAFAKAGQNLAKLSGAGIQREYLAAYSKLTVGASDLSASQREKLIKEILALNEQTLRNLDALRLIDSAYGALPEAHRKLETSVRDGVSLSFTELLTYAEALKRRYDEFTGE